VDGAKRRRYSNLNFYIVFRGNLENLEPPLEDSKKALNNIARRGMPKIEELLLIPRSGMNQ